MRRGPIINGWVRGEAAWRAGRRGADKWGQQHSAPNSVFKLNQVYFKQIQICPNFDRYKRCVTVLKKLEIKYGWKDLEIRNNFPYRNFSRFEKEFELKFRELL
jgi:hypothetical protein